MSERISLKKGEREEVRNALKKMKSGKASGFDSIAVELMMYSGNGC